MFDHHATKSPFPLVPKLHLTIICPYSMWRSDHPHKVQEGVWAFRLGVHGVDIRTVGGKANEELRTGEPTQGRLRPKQSVASNCLIDPAYIHLRVPRFNMTA